MAAGRPTVYKPRNAGIARDACRLGATNETLAERFEVCRRTIDNWIATIPNFSKAVRQGRRSRRKPSSRRCSRAPPGWSRR
jgi:hypothetical protein